MRISIPPIMKDTKNILYLPQFYVYSNENIKSLEWFDHIKVLINLTNGLKSDCLK